MTSDDIARKQHAGDVAYDAALRNGLDEYDAARVYQLTVEIVRLAQEAR